MGLVTTFADGALVGAWGMSIISTPSPADVTGPAAAIYADDEEHVGYVPEHTRVMAVNPEAYLAWETLIGAIARGMGKRRYELVTLAAARGVKSQHCLLAHGNKTLSIMEEDELTRIVRDYRTAGISEAEVAMMAFAEKVSTGASEMTDADSQSLRDVGYSDREIVDIALAAAARNYFSRAIQALGVAVDVPPALPASLKDALLEGI
jgi:uncharacterized peroxidase-related enzyme